MFILQQYGENNVKESGKKNVHSFDKNKWSTEI